MRLRWAIGAEPALARRLRSRLASRADLVRSPVRVRASACLLAACHRGDPGSEDGGVDGGEAIEVRLDRVEQLEETVAIDEPRWDQVVDIRVKASLELR